MSDELPDVPCALCALALLHASTRIVVVYPDPGLNNTGQIREEVRPGLGAWALIRHIRDNKAYGQGAVYLNQENVGWLAPEVVFLGSMLCLPCANREAERRERTRR